MPNNQSRKILLRLFLPFKIWQSKRRDRLKGVGSFGKACTVSQLLRRDFMAHELAHAVQIGVCSISGGWVRTIGTALVAEGLALQVSQEIFPGNPDKAFIEHKPGWLKEMEIHQSEILRNIQPFLSSSSLDDVTRFTMGAGASGFEKEAYYAGWLVVGYWLNNGMTFSDIARISEKDMPKRVQETIQLLLQNTK